MSDNKVSLECLYQNIDNPKIHFNASKKNFIVPRGQPKKYKKLLHDVVDDTKLVELLEDDNVSIVSLDMSEMLNQRLYDTVNFNIFRREYENSSMFSSIIDKEVSSRGLGWLTNTISAHKFVYMTWKNCVYGITYEKTPVSGLIKSENNYSGNTDNFMFFIDRRKSNKHIMLGYNYVWEMKNERPTCISDVKRLANTKKLKGDYTHDLYYIHLPKGFNEDDFKCAIRCIFEQYPKYKNMTLKEISGWWEDDAD